MGVRGLIPAEECWEETAFHKCRMTGSVNDVGVSGLRRMEEELALCGRTGNVGKVGEGGKDGGRVLQRKLSIEGVGGQVCIGRWL